MTDSTQIPQVRPHWTKKQLCLAAGISRYTLDTCIRNYGRPYIVRLPSGSVRIPHDEAAAFLDGSLYEELNRKKGA
ncbi:MAG: hypothetical protein AAF627_11885 [Myxococcota bacterium]